MITLLKEFHYVFLNMIQRRHGDSLYRFPNGITPMKFLSVIYFMSEYLFQFKVHHFWKSHYSPHLGAWGVLLVQDYMAPSQESTKNLPNVKSNLRQKSRREAKRRGGDHSHHVLCRNVLSSGQDPGRVLVQSFQVI